MRIKYTVALLFIVLVLAGCQSAPATFPDYTVMLTTLWPDLTTRCSGTALDPTTILTAAHCAKEASLKRVVTGSGQEAAIVERKTWDTYDLALVWVDEPLDLPSYAQVGEVQAEPGYVYATCPFYFPHTGRVAQWIQRVTLDIDGESYTLDQWLTTEGEGDARNQVCGGDSGGAVIQSGKVVGVLSAVEADTPFVAIGSTFFTVPGETLVEKVVPYMQKENTP